MYSKKNSLKACCVLLISLPFFSAAQTDFKALVDAEKGFAQYAADHNTPEAFMRFLADDGIVFRKGQAINGKERWSTIKPDSSLLSWYPAFADIAASGDMGFTTGPWEYRPAKTDKDAGAFGNYITIWKKQPDGTWKVAVDLGTSHAKPETADAPVAAVMAPATSENASAESLAAAERQFIASINNKDIKPYQTTSSPAVKIFRPGQLPYATPQAADEEKTSFTYTMTKSDIAKSGDFGYAYGTVVIKKNDKEFNAAYLRIWKLHNKKWELNLEVVSL